MTSISNSHEAMHREHRAWTSETGLWRDEISIWQKELAQTEAQVAELTRALCAHATELRKHAAAVHFHELDADAHERAIAEYQQGKDTATAAGWAAKHHAEEQRQVIQRAEHEQLKRYHMRLIAQWNHLFQNLHK